MKICIVGLPLSGKSSLFGALTGVSPDASAAKGTDPVGVVKVPDGRLEKLAELKGKGILTQEEFDAKKAELLKKLV